MMITDDVAVDGFTVIKMVANLTRTLLITILIKMTTTMMTIVLLMVILIKMTTMMMTAMTLLMIF